MRRSGWHVVLMFVAVGAGASFVGRIVQDDTTRMITAGMYGVAIGLWCWPIIRAFVRRT